ncbi:MAG: hypothetical protein DCC67_02365 [Planctomycetota bacterium]|nr:MAG: hypothetical protein DCC67_02365 [Planctomycetota bacterium]
MTALLPLKLADAERASGVLARALQNDPNFRRLFPHDGQRGAMLQKTLRYAVREGAMFGEVYAASPDFEGVAVWHPPRVATSMLAMLLRVGAVRLPFEIGLTPARRVLQFFNFVEDVRRALAPSEHWHLQLLGVEPAHQGRGYAKRLLSPMLEHCDKEQVACFLDTQNPINVRFYERLGFRVVHQGAVPPTKSDAWFMLRAPQRPSTQVE